MTRANAIPLTVAAQALALSGFAWANLKFGVDLYAYAIPTLLAIAGIGMKVEKPAIPRLEIVALVVAIFFIHEATHFAIFHLGWRIWWHFVAELAIVALCVQFFGRRWVKAGHISKLSNFWPE